MHQVRAARENVGLQRDAEAAAIIDHVDVVMRNAARPGIEIQPFVEGAGLRRLVHLLEHIAAPQREAAPARAPLRLQDHAVVAGAIELIGGAQPRYARAEDRDGLARAGAARQREACGERRRGLRKSHTASVS